MTLSILELSLNQFKTGYSSKYQFIKKLEVELQKRKL